MSTSSHGRPRLLIKCRRIERDGQKASEDNRQSYCALRIEPPTTQGSPLQQQLDPDSVRDVTEQAIKPPTTQNPALYKQSDPDRVRQATEKLIKHLQEAKLGAETMPAERPPQFRNTDENRYIATIRIIEHTPDSLRRSSRLNLRRLYGPIPRHSQVRDLGQVSHEDLATLLACYWLQSSESAIES